MEERTGRADLIAAIRRLVAIIDDGTMPVQNDALEVYLEALAGFLEDSDGYYLNQGVDPDSVDPYQRISDALHAATIYD